VVIDELRGQYDLSVLFYNPNIYPAEEYAKRKAEVVRVCEEWDIPILDQDYDSATWDAQVFGLEREREGGARCVSCIGMRLTHAAEVATRAGFAIFGTTLTMGRNKRAILITPLGEAAAAKAGIRYYAEDWKKKGREAIARTMVAERGIYRQSYCGCRYSIRHEREE
jgi:predicted adenine nucleotide alpha hydrolase (AANH) superfamily ATPase